MRRFHCSISFVFLLSCVTFAQTVTISGRVIHDDSYPWYACSVFTSRTHGTLTDSLGHYSLSVPKNQSVTLHFEELGYKARESTITPKEDCIVHVMLESEIPRIYHLSSIPASCIVCGSKKVAPILYGLPSKKGRRLIRRGKFFWGGFASYEGENYGCISCGQLYHISE